MKRSRITISIDDDVLEWITGQQKLGVYYNKSHAFEKIIKNEIIRQK